MNKLRRKVPSVTGCELDTSEAVNLFYSVSPLVKKQMVFFFSNTETEVVTTLNCSSETIYSTLLLKDKIHL